MTWRARCLLGIAGLLGLAGVVACSGLSEQEILDGKACTATGDCADGYVCDADSDRCVKRDRATTGTGGNDGGEGGGGGDNGGASGAGEASTTTGAAAGTGGEATGGEATGGEASGGAPTGGDASGGAPTGGDASGGAPTGGAPTGGDASGGAPTGGNASGGAPTGGVVTGGSPEGGASTAGAPPGGAPTGGGPAGGDDAGGAAGAGGLVPGICGDGVLNTGEECEPNEVDPCTEGCRIDCASFGLNGGQGTEHVLPDGSRHCYVALPTARSFDAAKAECATIGGHLATVHSDAENERVRSLVTGPWPGTGWIGATDGLPASNSSAGTYAWVTDEPFDYEPPAGFESDPRPCSWNCGHCATIARDGASTWDVAVCTSSLVGVCEWTPPG